MSSSRFDDVECFNNSECEVSAALASSCMSGRVPAVLEVSTYVPDRSTLITFLIKVLGVYVPMEVDPQ